MAQYIHYTFGNNSSGITNFGTGGAAYNGHAHRNQYALNGYGHPKWGPMSSGSDVIEVDTGLSNPYQHTWQIGLNIDQWWPVAGVVSGTLCGNDGKLFAYANDQFYAYLHQEGTYPPLVESGIYHFSVEIVGGSGDIEFWLGVGGNRPFKVGINGEGDEGGQHWWDFNYPLQLHTDYYFQIAINGGGVTGSDYYIGNCAPGCADYLVTGFPCGCYFYSWREDNTVLDLSKGGDWSKDVGLWTTKGGGGGGVTPAPVCPCPHIWFGISSPGTNLGYCDQNVGGVVQFAAVSGMVNSQGNWMAGKYDSSIVTCYEHDLNSGITRQLLRSQPDKNGNIRFAFTRPTVTKCEYWLKSDAHGENSGKVTVNWVKQGTVKPITPKFVPTPGFGGSSPTSASAASGSVACFVRGTDGGIYYKVYSGTAWSTAWTDIGGVTGGGTGPGVCSPGGGRYDVFTGGSLGVTYHKFNTGAKWGAWENLGGVAASSCGAACPDTGQWIYAVRGTNGACYQKSFYSGAWHAWMNLGGNIKAETGPTICSWGGGRADVFVIGTDSRVYHKSLSGGIWSTTWENLGGVATSSPAAAALGNGSLAIFVRGTDGGLWMRAFSGGAWQSWVELGGLMATGTGPGAAAEGSNYHVFVAGTDGQIYHSSGADKTWVAWENLGGKVSISPTEPGTMPGGLIPKPSEGGGGGGTGTTPVTTPEEPTDISLEPVEPVAAAMTEGLTILLRDHKRKA